MEFGFQFFPDVAPDVKSGAQYWGECLHLTGLAEELGYTSVRTVEHHFHWYGGYSPNPHLFLSAAAMKTKTARLITGAVLPIFNNPLKIAGEIAMLDSISGGRLECGFARAFLPHEFEVFGRRLDESKARFAEGIEQVRRLLEEENVTMEGEFHSFASATILPRPTQQPRPPFWVAALITPDSFENAGRNGFNVMAIPLGGGRMGELVSIYREAWKAAGHPGQGKIMMAHHMFCHEDDKKAVEIARDPINRYLDSLVESASAWMTGEASQDYPGYDKIIKMLSEQHFEEQVEINNALVGSPAKIRDQIEEFYDSCGGYDIASLQINFNDLDVDVAERSARLFAEEVMPHFRDK